MKPSPRQTPATSDAQMSTQVKLSASQQDQDGDEAMADTSDGDGKRARSNVTMTDVLEPAMEGAQTIDAVEHLI